jgi:5-methylcytosine-specific restriction endonuclease McrA
MSLPKKTRNHILERDSETCQLCGSPGDQIHHIILGGIGRKKDNSVENLITLCSTCHRNCHNGKLTQQYQKFCIEWSRGKYGHIIELIRQRKQGVS